MVASTLALALGVVFLLAVRLSGEPRAYGLGVFAGMVFVAAGCGLHLSAIVDQLLSARPALTRAAARAIGWLAVSAGLAWLVSRAPGDEVLVVLLGVPVALAVAGIPASRSRWPAVAFAIVVAILVIAIGPIWLDRQAAP